MRADELFYEDLSATLYDTTIDKVKSILAQAVDYGFFDIALFREHGILSSAEIQRQYLFSTKRRKSSAIDSRFCLINDPQPDDEACEEQSPESESATLKSQNVTSGTHSIAQHSIEKHSIAQESKANSLLNSSPKTGGTEGADGASAEEDSLYNKKIAIMQPPQDGQEHNLDGLIFNLRQFRISPQEQYAIILKSNFGVIGHPMWKGFYALRESHGKIRQPGRYLLSLCNK